MPEYRQQINCFIAASYYMEGDYEAVMDLCPRIWDPSREMKYPLPTFFIACNRVLPIHKCRKQPNIENFYYSSLDLECGLFARWLFVLCTLQRPNKMQSWNCLNDLILHYIFMKKNCGAKETENVGKVFGTLIWKGLLQAWEDSEFEIRDILACD